MSLEQYFSDFSGHTLKAEKNGKSCKNRDSESESQGLS